MLIARICVCYDIVLRYSFANFEHIQRYVYPQKLSSKEDFGSLKPPSKYVDIIGIISPKFDSSLLIKIINLLLKLVLILY